ncbi:hypothetical protein [Methylobacterium organophilum]|uniref:Uncharacterized protein n=1 Tax=Methylobacterium organophilum TaxID=410 RepID=A0ABQ4TA79_METOR|nr:hypothetical protein [Methylobacterium organophilum]GJE27231.1 hypothetical protein LKMONMHP_2088 [Methylobacterium organophilum]
MSAQSDGVADIHAFIEGISFEDVLADGACKQTFAQAYKYVHALLIWHEAVANPKKPVADAQAVLQFRELLSDLAACQVLLLLGMYKPARMMLRSSIENILRTVAHEQGFLTSGAKFTYELITLVRSSKIGADGSPVKNDLNQLIQMYSDLCSYAHAADEAKLALRVPLESVSRFDKSQYESLVDGLKYVSQRTNKIMFVMYASKLRLVHHSQRDYILDALPKALKAAILVP